MKSLRSLTISLKGPTFWATDRIEATCAFLTIHLRRALYIASQAPSITNVYRQGYEFRFTVGDAKRYVGTLLWSLLVWWLV